MTVQSCAGEKSASQLKPQLNKTTKQCPLGVLCREERSWDWGWGFVQGSTKKLSDFTVCKALPYNMKKIKTSFQAPETPLVPNKPFSCWNYSSCSNLFIVRDRMTSSTLQNTKSIRCFQEIRHQRASWTQPGISCNTTFTNCPRICGGFYYSDIPLLLWKSKK